MNGFINELVGATIQVLLFTLVPFIWWLITARKKENFFKWIGFKKPEHKGNIYITLLIAVGAVLVYGFGTTALVNMFSGEITAAGSAFAGKGLSYIPAALAYGFIRTGLSEEILFRGFILKRIQNKFGFAAGNVIQALAFGLMHGVPFGIATHNIGVTILLTILPGMLGFFMGWLNEKKFAGSVVPGWILHGVTNAIVTIISL
ncbi:MAG: CPBP family intramembrane metalloprotease [Lachnospiraceae bacterium]|nr:CPBP family intramembrane metalloprotease [Lachnospiraceae bacterium]